MINLNIVAEGSTEETFVNNVLKGYFAPMGIYVYTRKILTGWNKTRGKPAKGGFLKYSMFKNDVNRWIENDRNKHNTYYTSLVDLYGFPKDIHSPYIEDIQKITDPYNKVEKLEEAIGRDINHPRFIPYVQLHEFEVFLLCEPHRLIQMYPDRTSGVEKLIQEIGGMNPEEINEKPTTSPSKRVIKYVPEYEGQKAQVGPLVAEDIGLDKLRECCKHFNNWISKIENLIKESTPKSP